MRTSASYVGDGATTRFTIDFEYTDASSLLVSVNEVDVPFNLSGTSSVEVVPAPAAGSAVRVYRRTAIDEPKATFENVQVLTAGNLNDAFEQLLHSEQELWDEMAVSSGSTLRGLRGEAISSIPTKDERAGKTLAFDPDGQPIAIAPEGEKGDPGGNVLAIGTLLQASTLAIPAGTNTVRTSGYSADGFGAAFYVYDAAVDIAYVVANPRTSFRDTTGRGFRLALDQVLRASMFGAVGGGILDDRPQLQAFNDFVFGTVLPVEADFTTNSAIDGQLFLGPNAILGGTTARRRIGGELNLQQLSPVWESVRIRNLRSETWNGRITVKGIGTSAFGTRTCGVGIALEACRGTRFTGGLRAFNFWYAGVTTPVTNNNMVSLGTIEVADCGSGHAAGSLTALWSTPVNFGATGSGTQYTTLNVSAFPDAAFENYEAVATQQCQVRIGGYLYKVKALDRVAGTINVYPWIDPTKGTSGSLDWVFGAGFLPMTADGNCIGYDLLIATNCGRALSARSFYGVAGRRTVATSCGTAVCFGADGTSSSIGHIIDGLYCEGDCLENLAFLGKISETNFHYISSTQAFEIGKVWALADARSSTGEIVGGSLLDLTGDGRVTIAHKGRLLRAVARNLSQLSTASFNFRLHADEPRIHAQARDSQTVNLQVVDTAFNRLFGFRGGTLRYVGTGTRGTPTGSFTFVPPAGGKVNGGAVDATAVFSGFTGPADFIVYHNDPAQLDWTVRPVGGTLRAAAPTVTYAAATGGATIDTQARASQVQLAADLADLRAKLATAGFTA